MNWMLLAIMSLHDIDIYAIPPIDGADTDEDPDGGGPYLHICLMVSSECMTVNEEVTSQ